MHRPCHVPYFEPRITVCPNGCAHLQIGPTIVMLSPAGLRALAAAARAAVDQLPPDEPSTETEDGVIPAPSSRSIN